MDTIHAEQAVSVTTADSYVVVSLWRSKSGGPDAYEYEAQPTLNDALDLYADYESNQWERARAIGIFPARNGMPLGGRLEPHYIARLLAETRAA